MEKTKVSKLIAGIRCFPPAFELMDEYGLVLSTVLDFRGGNRKVEEDHFYSYNDDIWRRTVHVGNPDKGLALKIIPDNFVYENSKPKELPVSWKEFESDLSALWETYVGVIPTVRANRIGIVVEWRGNLDGTIGRIPAFSGNGFLDSANSISAKPLVKYEIRYPDESSPADEQAYYNAIVQLGTVHDLKTGKDTDVALSIDYQRYFSGAEIIDKRTIQQHFTRALKFIDNNFEHLSKSLKKD